MYSVKKLYIQNVINLVHNFNKQIIQHLEVVTKFALLKTYKIKFFYEILTNLNPLKLYLTVYTTYLYHTINL